MTAQEAIKRALLLSTCPLTFELQDITPKLARALEVAMEQLQKVAAINHEMSPACCENKIVEINQIFEEKT